ncbi:hypothetical protein GMOD_00001605 [Pyrenophora seminiperda CCB06]|uniref:Uncharacterized protein n=1 Tax=Pyrenophora seminiperda CCB06 TaxID=1302712 RepID=A0A3M7LZL5_9PLEO|nr:hypothetical protein GMOD_00001605 [Pyrenophora seminiperda CCB06]
MKPLNMPTFHPCLFPNEWRRVRRLRDPPTTTAESSRQSKRPTPASLIPYLQHSLAALRSPSYRITVMQPPRDCTQEALDKTGGCFGTKVRIPLLRNLGGNEEEAVRGNLMPIAQSNIDTIWA